MRTALLIPLFIIVGIVAVYTIRHYIFTLNRLFGTQRQPYVDIGTAQWPPVTILVPAHNEEKVIAGMLDALLGADYPPDRLSIVVINDRSTDGTKEILDDYARRFPGRVKPRHRTGGLPGKAAALAEISGEIETEVILVFDADYLPGAGLIKQLVAPFFDPEVGAVMGRVVPLNLNRTLLTRLLDLERSGGYQVDQQARMNLGLVPQYGGTVGGVRRSALVAVGGWRADALAEDTDMTYRLIVAGWQVVYQNRSECYEEVPENWPTRIRQIKRWARGHNQALATFAWPLLKSVRRLPASVVFDGFLLLGVFAVGPLLLVGFGLATALYYVGFPVEYGILPVLGVATYSTLGNFAAFFEVATAARLDGSRNRIRLLPFLMFGFLVSLTSASVATVTQMVQSLRGEDHHWEKTERYRNGNGNGGNGGTP
jgi:cellulose synthase/poly-beta-1,6-N-acetylglucosamine synthase-like glycosyltransferase